MLNYKTVQKSNVMNFRKMTLVSKGSYWLSELSRESKVQKQFVNFLVVIFTLMGHFVTEIPCLRYEEHRSDLPPTVTDTSVYATHTHTVNICTWPIQLDSIWHIHLAQLCQFTLTAASLAWASHCRRMTSQNLSARTSFIIISVAIIIINYY